MQVYGGALHTLDTDTLMRMQSAYDIAETRKRAKGIRVKRVQCAAINLHP